MDGAAFCIACGSPPPLTSERLCENCLRARTVFSEVPERIQQYRCAKCGMHEVEKRWVNIEDDELGELRLRENLGVTDGASDVAVDMSYQPIDERTARLHVNVEGQLEGHKFSDQYEVLLQTSNAVCPTCTRKAGATWRDMEKATVVSSFTDQIVVDVLNRDTSGAEVMDPTDYRVVTVALPYDDDGSLTNLRIAFIDDLWMALPGHTGEE